MLQLLTGGGLGAVVDDPAPVLGGDLDGGGHDISNVGAGTFGRLAVNGFNLVITTTGTRERESILRSFISDAGDDTFGVGNGTTVAGRFVPVFYGLVNSTNSQSPLGFRGFVTAANDAADSSVGGLVSFVAIRTDLPSDPIAGMYTVVQNRKLFTFATTEDATLLVIAANKNVGIGTGTPEKRLHIVGDGSLGLMIEEQTSGGAATLHFKTSVGVEKQTIFRQFGATHAYAGMFSIEREGEQRFVIVDGGNTGIGTVTPATSAKLELASTAGALLLTRMTTAQRDALTAVNGMVLYNTTLNKFQGYENGGWVSLI